MTYKLVKTNYTWKQVVYDWKVIQAAIAIKNGVNVEQNKRWLLNEALRHKLSPKGLAHLCCLRWNKLAETWDVDGE